MQVNARTTAWTQGIATAVVVVALAITLFTQLRRPFDADTLAIQVEALQSHAAEAAQLALLQQQDRVTPGFAAEHAAQLSEDVQRAQDALAGKNADAALEPARTSARELGGALHARLLVWSGTGGQVRTRDFGFDGLARQLDALRHRFKPED